MPVYASDLGVDGTFDYTVQTFGLSGGEDAVEAWASYDPANPAITNGQYATVPKRGSASVDVEVNGAAYADQQPLGSMVVVYDNKSGTDEALLVKLK